MSEYDLIPQKAYENLPEDAHLKFAALVEVAQENLARMLDNSESGDFVMEMRSQFIIVIGAIAEALGIDGLPQIGGDLAEYAQYQVFRARLAGVVAKVRLQGDLVAKPYSVALGRVTKARIQQEIDQLRHSIGESDIDKKKKEALLDKLTELEEELALVAGRCWIAVGVLH